MNIALPGKARVFQARQREQAERERTRLGVEARSWYRITNATDPDEAEVMLYDEIGGWFGSTADDLIAELKTITAPRMRVRVNSPGGSVFEGVAIANALRSHPASVTIQVDGIAASIASVIAMAGDRIEMAPNTMLMIHDASGVAMGNAADMEEMAELLDVISDNIADAYAARAGGTRDEWRARMRSETWYLPEDAVDAGLADEAVQMPKQGTPTPAPAEEPEPEMRRAFDLTAYGYQGPRREEPTAEAGLTEDIRSLIGEEIAAQLAAIVAPPPVEATPPAPVDQAAPEPATEEPASVPEPVASAAEPEDEWTADIAALLTPAADDWAADLTHLIGPDTSSRAATAA